MIRFLRNNNKRNIRNYCTIKNNSSSTLNNNKEKGEDYYDDENPENQSFNWLTKRIDKKVNKYEKPIETNSSNTAIGTNSSTINTNNSTFNNTFKNYFNLLKDEYLKEELKNASIEIQSNKPIDRANLTLATLIRVCGKLTDEESRVKEIIKKLLLLNGINQYTIENVQDIDSFKFSLDQVESLMSEYLLRGNNVMVKQVFDFTQSNKDRFSDFHQKSKLENIYYLYMESLSNNGDIKQLLKLSGEMEQENQIKPNQNKITKLICLGYSNSNQGEKAYNYLKNSPKQQQQDIDIAILNSILNCFSRQGNLKLMETVYNEMIIKKQDHNTIQILVEGYLKVHQTDRAIQLLKEFDTHERKIANTTQTFNQIFIQLGKSNRLDEMMDLFENVMMRPNKLMVESLSTETDFELLSKLQDQVVSNFKPNINTVNYLINACCQSNNIDKAFELFNYLIPKYNLQANSETFSNLEAISFKFKKMDLYNQYCSNDFHIVKKED
ncbi:hypothetical protein DICPUDRAFT_42873 [Dictyostelium purpureum]|uniref:Pentacotripeptide-repeat region of PRORP domain-containing protein n=1 Tax=Dictyostelium purpureum TaxID=5786 RepID=F1A2Z3_DICPU|nr:uncharacterized protein DICPUDRAFT_42873 [Dictyostelium purpureum]EGC29444.1 hypothetical protein DICPUDRAFT_42873 [Dictyostelium purpureum]|eukprot:XP_003294037.1 hypothetical protein DICPUDRAFT_42873 [Dictyostelium purpureum]